MYLLFSCWTRKGGFYFGKNFEKAKLGVCGISWICTQWLDRAVAAARVVGAISPLHDKDLNATGEPKKAHWHVIVTYEGPTAQSVVERLTERLNAPKPIPLEQVRGIIAI